MSHYFQNKRILITGASSGIGFALSKALAKQGAKLVLIARNKEKLEKTSQELLKAQSIDNMDDIDNIKGIENIESIGKIESHVLDICDQQAVKNAMSQILEKPLDILINNAGIAANDHFENLDEQCFQEMIETNFLAQVRLCRYALAEMKKRQQGHIVNVSSMAGVLGITGYTAYGASKFALVGFTRALRNELAGTKIKTTLVLPSDVDTPQLHAEESSRTPANRAVVGTGAKILSPELAAHKILTAIRKQYAEVVISTFSGRVLLLLCQLFPKISHRVIDYIASKHQK